MNFGHLHLHTHYSFLQGLGKPNAFVEAAKEAGVQALAITDRANLHGAFEFYTSCKKSGIKPIIGLEVLIARDGMTNVTKDDHIYRLTLLSKNLEGYKNLIKIVTEAYMDGMHQGNARIDMSILQKYNKDIIALSGDHMGEISQHITTGQDEDTMIRAIEKYKEIYEDDYYLEIQEHPDRANQSNINQKLIDLGKKTHTPVVATLDIHYPTTTKSEAQDLLSCMATHKALDDPDRNTLIDGNYSIRPESEMNELFSYCPEALENIGKIVDKIDLEIPYGDVLLPVYELNDIEKPIRERYLQSISSESGLMDMDHEQWLLRYNCIEGLNERYDFGFSEDQVFEFVKKTDFDTGDVTLQDMSPKQLQDISQKYFTSKKWEIYQTLDEEQKGIIDRLEYELVVVDLMGYNAYFIIVADFISWSRRQGIPVGPGRGSAAGALLAYLSGITNIDPLPYGLLFERFLNPARVSMPDIDIDFADDRRDEVIDYVRDKYGHDHVAQICTFGTMAARAALKDVGRALGVPFAAMNDFAKQIPAKPGITIEKALEESPEFKQSYDREPRYAKIIDNARELEGTVRQLGVHACAVIIAPEPITSFCPMQHPPKDDQATVTQFSAYPLEDLGLLKMDFLGLRNLTIIDRALRIIKNHHGIEIDIDKIDMEDQKVFDVFSAGDTTGVFQFESSGMRKYLKDLQPNSFEDIIVMVSLYRPGPLQYIPTYINRKHGREKVKFPDPSLAQILELTQGIAVYQEQIMQIVQKFAGFSLGEADILRRAMGKKILSLMEEQKTKFVDAAVEQGHKKDLAEYIFTDIIEPFAGYGFNKSHAACYSMIAYQTAYLKAYYPTEFLTALLVSDEEDMERVVLEVNEAKSKGINILPPDVNESRKHFTFVDKENIRFGLKAIKGLGDQPVSTILEGREGGKYSDITDFIERTGGSVINKKSLEALVMSGAMDGLGDRSSLLESIEKMSAYLKELEAKKNTNQMGLFDTGGSNESINFSLNHAEKMSFEQKISYEKEVIGYPVSGSPLQGLDRYIEVKSQGLNTVEEYKYQIDNYDTIDPAYENTEEEDSGGKKKKKEKISAQLIGYIQSHRKIQTKTGKMMLVADCESSFFNFKIVIFPRDYDKLHRYIRDGELICAKGTLSLNLDMKEISLAPESIKNRSITDIRAAAKYEGLFDLDRHDESGGPKVLEDVTVTKPKSNPKRTYNDYILVIPKDAPKDALHKLKEFLGTCSPGDNKVFIDLQGQRIDTKFCVDDTSQLENFFS